MCHLQYVVELHRQNVLSRAYTQRCPTSCTARSRNTALDPREQSYVDVIRGQGMCGEVRLQQPPIRTTRNGERECGIEAVMAREVDAVVK